MRIVGLTGGIGSGKSTVSNLFKAHDIPIVDADVVARNVLKKGTGGWRKVVAAFGDEILLPNGEVDRPKLGQIVFNNSDMRQLLNRLLAPHISSGIFLEVFKLWLRGCKIIVLDVPLLFEAKMDKWTNPIIVVWVDPNTQLRQLMGRDGTTVEETSSRIGSQMSLDLKRTKADIVIDNTGSIEQLNDNFRDALMQVKDALTQFDTALPLNPNPEEAQVALYNKACCHAYRGEGKKASDCLQTALREYNLKFGTILNEPDLASFRALPEFKELQEEARLGGEDIGYGFRRDLKLIGYSVQFKW